MQHKDVGFVGLGVMGSRMAGRLLKAGHRLTVYDPESSNAAVVGAMGARIVSSPSRVAESSDVVHLSLPHGEAVHLVLAAEQGLLSAARDNLIIVDHSTIGPEWAVRCAEHAAKFGARMLDAPVGGGWAEAEDGTLVLMVGGDAGALEEVRPILATIGKALFHFGDPGTGQAVKLALNMSVAVLNMGAAEAVRLVRELGVDLSTFLETLESLDSNPWFQRPLRHTIEGSYPAGFRIDLAEKDIRLATEASAAADVDVPAGRLALELFRLAQQRGFGSEHLSAIVKLYE